MSEEIKRPKDLVFKNTPIELKEDGDTRYLEAVFSLFDKVDSDNDITVSGALKSGYEGNKVPLVWNHDWSKVIGRGVIESDNEKAVFKGYFLNTESGKEAYETVKQMRDMQQFSYGFQVLDSETSTATDSKGDEIPVRVLKDVKVWEVSPVLVGSQQNSFVQALKSGLDQFEKEEDIEDEEEEKRALGDDIYTTREEAEARAEELGCSGAHEHQKDGETVYMPCASMDDYTTLTGQRHRSEDDTTLVYAGKISSETDTEISTSTQQGKRLEEQALSSLEEIKAFTERIEDLALLRNSEKKTMSSKSTELLSKYLQGLNAIYNRLDDVLETHGYDEVSDDELFLEVQKNIFKNQ
tara:strand:- start:1505 stop:2563 length:1059 start_codon:yes stop_codon:yes gene_type:complete